MLITELITAPPNLSFYYFIALDVTLFIMLVGLVHTANSIRHKHSFRGHNLNLIILFIVEQKLENIFGVIH